MKYKCEKYFVLAILIALSLALAVPANAGTTIGTYSINYRFNAGGCNLPSHDANPYYCQNGPGPGPIVLTVVPGVYEIQTIAIGGGGANPRVWVGAQAGGRGIVLSNTVGVAIYVSVASGDNLVLYQHDWYAWDNPDTVWTQVRVTSTPAGPGQWTQQNAAIGSSVFPAHADAAAGFDPVSHTMIFYGGVTPDKHYLSDTWVLAGTDGVYGPPTWIKLNITGQPIAGRWAHAAAYDFIHQRLIVYGGCLDFCLPLDDNVYVLSNADGRTAGASWQKLNIPGTHPSPRQRPTAVYDSVSNRLILFGGTNGSGGNNEYMYNDVWVLTNANGLGGTPQWIQLMANNPAVGPMTRTRHIAAYDPTSNRMIIGLGEGDPTGKTNCNSQMTSCDTKVLNDIWVLTNANGLGGGIMSWIRLNPFGFVIPARFLATGVYDQINNRLIIFGGSYTDNVTKPGTGYNDVWVVTDANGIGSPQWKPQPQTAPPPTPPQPGKRWMAIGAYSAPSNSLFIYGGMDTSSTGLTDVWVLNDANGIAY